MIFTTKYTEHATEFWLSRRAKDFSFKTEFREIMLQMYTNVHAK